MLEATLAVVSKVVSTVVYAISTVSMAGSSDGRKDGRSLGKEDTLGDELWSVDGDDETNLLGEADSTGVGITLADLLGKLL
jgi:hypothetical protein